MWFKLWLCIAVTLCATTQAGKHRVLHMLGTQSGWRRVTVIHREQTEVSSTARGFWCQSSSANAELKIDMD